MSGEPKENREKKERKCPSSGTADRIKTRRPDQLSSKCAIVVELEVADNGAQGIQDISQNLRIPSAIGTRSCAACYHRPIPRRASRSAEKSCK